MINTHKKCVELRSMGQVDPFMMQHLKGKRENTGNWQEPRMAVGAVFFSDL